MGDVAGQASVRPTDEGAPRAHVHPDRDPVRSWERPEQVVEGSVLLDDEHDVLDRRPRGERVGVHDPWRERRDRRGGRDVRATGRRVRGSEPCSAAMTRATAMASRTEAGAPRCCFAHSRDHAFTVDRDLARRLGCDPARTRSEGSTCPARSRLCPTSRSW